MNKTKIKTMLKTTNQVLNQANGSQPSTGTNLYLYGDIGEDWFGYGITALAVRTALNQIEDDVINVHIHSNGGDAFEGIAIYNVFKQSPKTINVYIDGLAASAASIIALAGDKIFMPRNTQLMIHNAATFIYGFAEDFEKTAVSLRNINDSVRQTYMSRFEGSEDELIKYMDDETFFTAEQAFALKLVDEILDYDSQPADDDDEDNSDEAKKEPQKDDDPKKSDSENEADKEKVQNVNFNRFAAFANSLEKITRIED